MRYPKIIGACIAAIVLHTASFSVAAQPQTASSDETDFCIWTIVGFKKPLTDKLTLKSDLEIRTKDNTTAFNLALFTIELSYKFNKYFALEAAYVPYVVNAGYGTSSTYFRYYINAVGTLPAGNWRFSLREKFQQSFLMDSEVSMSKGNPATILRSRPQITYKIPGTILTPNVSVEVAIRLFDPKHQIMDHIRYTAGIGFALDAHNNIFPFYRYYQRFGSSSPDKHILGVNYYYTF